MRTWRRTATVLAVGVGLVVGADVARAHDPIILTDEQTTPDAGPFLPDGTISFALYGSFNEAGETRGLRAQFVEGDRLHVSLLIPNLAPENTLSNDELPTLEIVDPAGESLRLEPETRTIFDEPFTGTSYVELVDHIDEAAAGVYAILVTGRAPSRFTVSVGDKETFGTPVEGVVDRAAGIGGVMQWYAASPEGEPTTDAPAMAEPTTDVVTTEGIVEESAVRGRETAPEEDDQNGATRAITLALVTLVLLAVVRISRKSRHRSKKSSPQ